MSKKITCIAVDDEPLAIEQLKNFIGRIDFLDLKATFDNAFDALSYIKSNEIDLVFLDIEMEDFTGIELLESLDLKPFVILTTAYDKYALKGYELHVFDYLLKPISYQRFIQAVNRVHDMKYQAVQLKAEDLRRQGEERDYLFVKTKYKLQKVKYSDILYIESMSNYLIIKTPEEKIYTLQSFGQILENLPPAKFIRIHKTYLVSVEKIDEIMKNNLKIGDVVLPIGESYKQFFFDFLRKNKIL